MLIDRLNAMLWTCAIELPVYAWWLHGRFSRTSLLIALVIGLQLTTQPLLWEYTSRTAGAIPNLLLAEGVVWLVEALMLYALAHRFCLPRLTMPRTVVIAGSANLLSFVLGLALNHWVYG
jgi:hypothetical protein